MDYGFKPHGDYVVISEKQFLITEVRGSWNVEMHARSILMSAALVQELNSIGPWGVLVKIVDTLVTSKDVLQAGQKTVSNSQHLANLKGLAWIISPDVEGYRLLIHHYKNLYDGVLPTRVFENQNDAKVWLAKLFD